jgi:hypothetical protein
VASLAAKAAKRDDVRELVRLTYAFPGDADEIDSALQQVVTRLDPDRSISDLAHVLTLPDRTKPWAAVDAAIGRLIAVGPRAKQPVLVASRALSEAATPRALAVLEGWGDEAGAATLRSRFQEATVRGSVPQGGHQTAEWASADRFQGLGGWLVLPIIGLFLNVLLAYRDFSVDVLPTLRPGVWNALTSPQSMHYHPLWARILIFNAFAYLASMFYSILLLVLVFQKRRIVPKLMVAMYSFAILVALANAAVLLYLGVSGIGANMDWATSNYLTKLFAGIAAAGLWSWYFMASERVKNTFIR